MKQKPPCKVRTFLTLNLEIVGSWALIDDLFCEMANVHFCFLSRLDGNVICDSTVNAFIVVRAQVYFYAIVSKSTTTLCI